MYALAKILAVIRQRPRYFPETDWSKNTLWVNKVCRAFEAVFGRDFEIRRECSAVLWFDENGVQHSIYTLFTWESYFAFQEVKIRQLLKQLSTVRITIPLLQLPYGIILPASPYLFAIANDSSGKDGAGGTGTVKSTFSFTNTAGNVLFACDWSNGGNPTTVTMEYPAGTSMSQIGTSQASSTTAFMSTFGLGNAATGANNFKTTYTSSSTSGFFTHCMTYSGGNTASPFANAAQQVTGNIGNDSIAVTITTTASSWAGWFIGVTAGRSYTAGTNTAIISGATDAQATVFDSGGIASSSPWTLNATVTAGTEIKLDTAFEIKAGAAAPTVTIVPSSLSFMHAG